MSIIWTITTGARLLDEIEYAWDRLLRSECCPLGICDGSGVCPGATLEDSERECPCRL